MAIEAFGYHTSHTIGNCSITVNKDDRNPMYSAVYLDTMHALATFTGVSTIIGLVNMYFAVQGYRENTNGSNREFFQAQIFRSVLEILSVGILLTIVDLGVTLYRFCGQSEEVNVIQASQGRPNPDELK